MTPSALYKKNKVWSLCLPNVCLAQIQPVWYCPVTLHRVYSMANVSPYSVFVWFCLCVAQNFVQLINMPSLSPYLLCNSEKQLTNYKIYNFELKPHLLPSEIFMCSLIMNMNTLFLGMYVYKKMGQHRLCMHVQ